MNENCIVCGRRKGQRQCPALGGVICPQCCGRGRRKTVACPDSCRYARQAAAQAAARLAELGGDARFEAAWRPVLDNLRLGLVRVRQRRLADLTDEEARQALANVSETMRTRSRKLVYEFRSPDPRIQLVSDELLLVAGRHETGEKGFARVEPADIASCLRYLERQVKTGMGRNRGSDYYLGLAADSLGTEFAVEQRSRLA